jgi:hypothetical protein
MESTRSTFRKTVIMILAGGVTLFLAVFVGIQIGYALKGGKDKSSSMNAMTSGKPSAGDRIPSLKLFADENNSTNLREIVSDSKALVVFAMPGCNSCSDVLSGWKANGIVDRRDGTRVIVVVATPPGDFDAKELVSYASSYPLYFCENTELYLKLNVRGLPAVLGVSKKGLVSFFTNDAKMVRDTTYIRSNI